MTDPNREPGPRLAWVGGWLLVLGGIGLGAISFAYGAFAAGDDRTSAAWLGALGVLAGVAATAFGIAAIFPARGDGMRSVGGSAVLALGLAVVGGGLLLGFVAWVSAGNQDPDWREGLWALAIGGGIAIVGARMRDHPRSGPTMAP